jgi:NADH-quinone oxidoreductase subunit G
MIEIEIDGKKLEVAEGSMVIQAAEANGTYIPHFCYHRKLTVAANCRMCLVEVEKAPKPMPACATPVAPGMVVRTHSDKAVKAQKSVMEFLLINHPLDCPVCDQGGECQLQDLAVGYGASASRYAEEKRVVVAKDAGALVSMEEMSRCIQCTRCVRFGQEVAGDMELGMIHRGEHSEITTVKGETIESELSGNMIDICPVGALTSKPFRYAARTWELSRRKSIAPHDSSGANLQVQVKNNRVMRVLPLENEAVNECWIADRERFSYEALNGEERLTKPMLKQNGQWLEVEWQTALEYVASGLKNIGAEHGAASIGGLLSPHSTVEELHLATQLLRGLGTDHIDSRLRHAQFSPQGDKVRWLGLPIAALSQLQSVLVVGSYLRKDHPLFAARVRQAQRQGAQVFSINSQVRDWALPKTDITAAAGEWLLALGKIAAAIAAQKGVAAPVAAQADEAAQAVASSLLQGERKAILLGNAAAHHAQADALLALANWMAEQTGASVGYLTEAANTVGAQWVGAMPQGQGKNASQMAAGAAAGLRAMLLLNVEPEHDTAAARALEADMVVTLSPFKANMAFSDVLLPIAPFSETAGSFVNAEGRVQSFHGVVKPLGETRPAWKVLRALGNTLGLQKGAFAANTADEVLAETGLKTGLEALHSRYSNKSCSGKFDAENSQKTTEEPCSAAIYQLDSIVRRAPSLQATRDGRLGRLGREEAA